MKIPRTIVALLIILSLWSIPQTVLQARTTSLIDRSVATEYVKNLLTSYNALITQSYGYSPDSSITSHFRLYQAVGESFNVTVMRVDNWNHSLVAFVFLPILAPSPQVTIDNESNVCGVIMGEASIICLRNRPYDDLGFAVPGGSSAGTTVTVCSSGQTPTYPGANLCYAPTGY